MGEAGKLFEKNEYRKTSAWLSDHRDPILNAIKGMIADGLRPGEAIDKRIAAQFQPMAAENGIKLSKHTIKKFRQDCGLKAYSKKATAAAPENIKTHPDDHELQPPMSNNALFYLILETDKVVPIERINEWNDEQRFAAEKWAIERKKLIEAGNLGKLLVHVIPNFIHDVANPATKKEYQETPEHITAPPAGKTITVVWADEVVKKAILVGARHLTTINGDIVLCKEAMDKQVTKLINECFPELYYTCKQIGLLPLLLRFAYTVLDEFLEEGGVKLQSMEPLRNSENGA